MTAPLRKTLLAVALAAAAGGASAAVTINDGLDGTWLNAAESGRGVAIDVIPGANGSAVVSGGVFSYDAEGNPVWMTFAGTFAADETTQDGIALNLFDGGSFGSPFTAPDAPVQAGTASITIDSCTSMTLDLEMSDASGLPDVVLDLEPTQIALGGSANPLCSETPVLAACPASTTATGDDCLLPNSIEDDLFLPGGKKYIVRGQVAVEDGGTLTIAPGVTVEGSTDTSTPNFVAVKVGGRIYAEGTATQPITFTGPEAIPGSWAGLVIAGRSNCNDGTPEIPCEFEAVPEITYGGDDLNDSSGALRYVRILWAGQLIQQDEELNSLTLLGVGAGTVLEHVQVDGGLDDGFEMFGGSINGRYLVCSNMGDDCFDFDQGYVGKLQFLLGYQGDNPDIGGDSNGIESDNDGTDNNKLPRTIPTVSNLTLVGSEGGQEGMRIRRGSGGNYSNVVVDGYQDTCLHLIDAGTFALASGTAQGDSLSIDNSFIGQCIGGQFEDDAADPYAISAFYNAGTGNDAGDPMLNGFLPMPGSPLLEGGQSPSDAFFRPTTYRGAFSSQTDNWTAGWTVNLPSN